MRGEELQGRRKLSGIDSPLSIGTTCYGCQSCFSEPDVSGSEGTYPNFSAAEMLSEIGYARSRIGDSKAKTAANASYPWLIAEFQEVWDEKAIAGSVHL